MYLKLNLPTISRSIFVVSISLFLAKSWLILYEIEPLSKCFNWSARPTKRLKSALYPSEIKNASCNIPNPVSYPVQPPEEPDLHEQIRSYLAFHAKERACLLDPSCKRVPKILVAKCPDNKSCLGLGDRMRGLLFSFTIALMTKRVLFVHRLSELFPLESGLAPYAIDWSLPSTVPYNASWPHLQWQWCGGYSVCDGSAPALTHFENFDNVGPRINLLTDDLGKVFGNTPIASITSRNRFRRLTFMEKNPHLKDEYGDLAQYLLERKMNFYRLMFQPAVPVQKLMKPVEFTEDYVSIHIRTGVDADEDKLKRFSYWSTHEEETVENALRCVEKEGKNISKIFLAADSLNTKEIFKSKAKERGYELHLFEKETAHYSKVRKRLGKDHWDNVCEGTLTVFADLFMLSRAKVMIKTGSHFSALARSFSKDQRTFDLYPDGECKTRSVRI